MNEIMLVGLIGEEAFAQLLIDLPDDFFGLHRPVQDDLWRQVLIQVNRGVTDIEKLISFAKLWIVLYQREVARGPYTV